MEKSELSILIVDDDQTFGNSLKESLSRTGYKVTWCQKPDEALHFASLHSAHVYLIDCMLPKMNGVDLAIKLKESASAQALFVFMSGIYRDKNFAKTALKKANAHEFLTKPFAFDALEELIAKQFLQNQETISSPLYEMMTQETHSARQIIKAVNYSEDVNGQDLPWIFSLLMNPQISGYLNIVLTSGEVAGVGFNSGNIVSVSLKDTQSYFGSLLIEKAFISAEDFEQVLNTDKSNLRIGEKLVKANLLSPHAIDIVAAEQVGIRLSKLIDNTSVHVNFNKSEDVLSEATLDPLALAELLETWITTKLSVEWIKSLYLPYVQSQIKKGAKYSTTHRVLHLPSIARFPNFVQQLIDGLSIESILEKGQFEEFAFYQALHILVLEKIIIFDTRVKSVDLSVRQKRLNKLDAELDEKNYFERLNLSVTAKETEIKRAYHEMAKALHPDTLDRSTSSEILELSRRVFDKIQIAYDTLKNKSTKDQYLKELEMGKAENIMKADSLTEKGKDYLRNNNLSQAFVLFNEAMLLCPPSLSLKLHHIWCSIKLNEAKRVNSSDLEKYNMTLKSVPAEDRHTPVYYFVRSLVQKTEGRYEEAIKGFQHVLHLDPGFIHARREISFVKGNVEGTQKKDLLKADLKDVVGMLFKRKK